MKVISLLLFTIFFLGCSDHHPTCEPSKARLLEEKTIPSQVEICSSRKFIVEIDSQFDCSEPDQIREAWKNWIQIIEPQSFEFVTKSNIDNSIESCKFKVIKQNSIPQFAGYTFWFPAPPNGTAAARIWINDSLPSSTFKDVALHEVGHALGVDHNSNPKSIMYYKDGTEKQVITCEDKKNLCAVWGCNINCTD